MIKFQVKQQGLQGAEFRTLEPMAGIRLKNIIPGVPAGAVGCRIQDPGTHGKQQANSGGKPPTFRTACGAPPKVLERVCFAFVPWCVVPFQCCMSIEGMH